MGDRSVGAGQVEAVDDLRGHAALRASDEVELVVAVHGVFHLLDERALNAPAGRGRRNAPNV
jgi:hypothetical protein